MNKLTFQTKHKQKVMTEQQEININQNTKLPFSSEIINSDNINIFESLVCKTNQLKLLYRMTEDGGNNESIQNKINNHSNIVVLIKTEENKIFGGCTRCKIDYDEDFQFDNKAFLFSLNLNMKFNIKENRFAILNQYNLGICFGMGDLVIFNYYKCYSSFGKENSYYENNGITIDEFSGGDQINDETSIFTPIEVEIYEIQP